VTYHTLLSRVIYHACANTPVYHQQTKFEVPSFTISKDTMGQNLKKNWSRDTDHAYFRGGLSSLS